MARNYLLYHLIHDRRFWIKFLIPGILVLVVLDILSYMNAPPGFFNLWVFYLSLAGLLMGLIYRTFRDEKKRRNLASRKQEQETFERQREREMLQYLQQDPGFHTFCYECLHFDQRSRSCSRDILNPKARSVRIAPGKTVCLYWEGSR